MGLSSCPRQQHHGKDTITSDRESKSESVNEIPFSDRTFAVTPGLLNTEDERPVGPGGIL